MDEESLESLIQSMVMNGEAAALGGSTFMVFCIIMAYYDSATGYASPPVRTIAEKSGLSDAQVERHIRTLKEKGYIETEKIGRNNRYTFPFAQLSSTPVAGIQKQTEGDALTEEIANQIPTMSSEMERWIKKLGIHFPEFALQSIKKRTDYPDLTEAEELEIFSATCLHFWMAFWGYGQPSEEDVKRLAQKIDLYTRSYVLRAIWQKEYEDGEPERKKMCEWFKAQRRGS